MFLKSVAMMLEVAVYSIVMTPVRLTARILSKLFRWPMLEKLVAAHAAGSLRFFRANAHLADTKRFAAFLAPLRRKRWFSYAKRPFAGPKVVLVSVTFKVRVEGPARYTTMTLATGEFIRRFLIHVLPRGFHRIRHYRLLTGTARGREKEDAGEVVDLPNPLRPRRLGG
jgi:hypothetical protein